MVKTSEKKNCPVINIIQSNNILKNILWLLVMCEKGSGKTTSLNAFVNYLADMNFDDPWDKNK